MAQFDITLRSATDTKVNWESYNRILHIGELAFATENGKVVEVKLGLGANYNNTPVILHPFQSIITSYGRDMDDPGGARDANHNFTNLNDAMRYILAPYVPPTIAISSPTSFPIQEVGDTYALTQAFQISINNSVGMLQEGNPKQKYLYIDAQGAPLADQISQAVNVAHSKAISANKNTDGYVEVLRAGVKREDNTNFVEAAIAVPFHYRSGYFLWPEGDNLSTKSDEGIMAAINGLGANIAGAKVHGIAGNGDINFGTVTFNTSLLGTGRYNIYTFYPTSRGTQKIAPDAFKNNPVPMTHTPFKYEHGTASGANYTPYTLTKMNSFIVGSYDAYMVRF